LLAAAGAQLPRIPAGSRWRLDESWMIDEIRAGHSATLPDVAGLPDADPHQAEKLHTNIGSTVALPIRADGAVFALLVLHLPKPGGLEPGLLDLATGVADSLAVALQNARLVDELKSSREQLRALSRRLVAVQESERTYVADQLFNQAGQVLAALQLQLSLLGEDGERELPAGHLPRMRATLNEAIHELHELASGLHPVGLDRASIARVLQSYLTTFGKSHAIAVQFLAQGTENLRLPGECSTAVFRAVQEGLTNVAQHARATEVALSLSQDAGKLIVTLADNGAGFDPLGALRLGGIGLAGIRERLETVGGQFTIESGRTGTTLRMEVPLDHWET
jgi:signal transduction histidine kinase